VCVWVKKKKAEKEQSRFEIKPSVINSSVTNVEKTKNLMIREKTTLSSLVVLLTKENSKNCLLRKQWIIGRFVGYYHYLWHFRKRFSMSSLFA
jgi:hypothetical protein